MLQGGAQKSRKVALNNWKMKKVADCFIWEGARTRIIRSDPGGPHSNAADSVGPQLSTIGNPIWVHSWLLERFSGADPGGPTFGQLISRGYFWADPGRSSFWAGSWGAHFSGADAQRPEKVASDPARPKVEAADLERPDRGRADLQGPKFGSWETHSPSLSQTAPPVVMSLQSMSI